MNPFIGLFRKNTSLNRFTASGRPETLSGRDINLHTSIWCANNKTLWKPTLASVGSLSFAGEMVLVKTYHYGCFYFRDNQIVSERINNNTLEAIMYLNRSDADIQKDKIELIVAEQALNERKELFRRKIDKYFLNNYTQYP